MGTINYGTSDFITLVFEPVQGFELLSDSDWVEFMRTDYPEIQGEELEALADEEARHYETVDFDDAYDIIDGYDFDWFILEMEHGYYGGSYLSLKYSPYYSDTRGGDHWFFEEDKADVYAEIPMLKTCLVELANRGMRSWYPGWADAYADYEGTLKDIDKAVEEIYQVVQDTPVDED